MNTTVECVLAGGPEHGLVLYLSAAARGAAAPTVIAADGQICRAAARRPSATCRARYVLAHPQASGRELLDALRVCGDAPRQRWHAARHPVLAA